MQCWAVGPKSNLSLTHTFTPPVEVTVLHNGEHMEPKDACKLLDKGIKWRCDTELAQHRAQHAMETNNIEHRSSSIRSDI